MLEKLFVFGLVTVIVCTGLLVFLETGSMAAVIICLLISFVVILIADEKLN